MNKYFANLRPMERRLVVGVAVVVVLVLNWLFVWPHFSDWGNSTRRMNAASHKLKDYQATVAKLPELQQKVKSFENEGEVVPPEDQGVNLIRNIQTLTTETGVQLQTSGRTTTSGSDPFFVKQILGINVLATETNLVDFLYKLGSGVSMIRVRDLSLQPDPPHQRLMADIRLEASYQKNSTASAAKNATAKAK